MFRYAFQPGNGSLSQYSQEFYQHQMQGSLRSAKTVVPMTLELVDAKSVLDVGCGVGTWLSIYHKQGVTEILGIDGAYVDRKLLMIDQDRFQAHNLSIPLDIDRKFDLVQSLEVAEHIGADYAAQFISELTRLGNVILFSAAVPCQLGTGHVNEQFIDYWIDLFIGHGYQPIDYLRPRIWDNSDVEVCYRQNMLLFASEQALATNPKLKEACRNTNRRQLSIIHPDLYQPRLQRLLATLLRFGQTVQGNGNFPLARETFTSILDFNPGNSRGWHALGQMEACAGNIDTAIHHLQRAIALDPQKSAFHYNLGQVYAATGRPDKAREHYNRALELKPDDPSIMSALADLPQ